ncbi:hypothetical protein N8986_02105 [Flavobacteriaceae bacterium]|nr:hypothetical protein [Flavobacteriaceae bacterium]
MKITREIQFEGNKLLIKGEHFKATPSEDGSLPIKAEFLINDVLDVEKNLVVTDLFYDLFSDISSIVLGVLEEESLDDVEYVNDSEDLPGLEDDIASYIYSEIEDEIREGFSKVSQSETNVPVLWGDDVDPNFHNRLLIESLLTELSYNMNDVDNPIIAFRVDMGNLRIIRINDVKQI